MQDFRSYLSERTEGKLSAQEIDAIASHKVVTGGKEMAVEESQCHTSNRIYIYSGDRGQMDFLRQAHLRTLSRSIDTDDGTVQQVFGEEIGYWIIGEKEQSRFGAWVQTDGQWHDEKSAYCIFNVNNAIAINSTWLKNDWEDELRIAIYLVG